MSDATLSTLARIKRKVRLTTNSQSANRLSDSELTDYINTFILYDFPDNLRLFNLHKTFTFYTKPYISVYSTNTTNINDPLYNFKNKYVNVFAPIYLAGSQIQLYSSQALFNATYTSNTQLKNLTLGDGITVNFTGTLLDPVTIASSPKYGVLQNNVLFSSIDANYNGLSLIDIPTSVSTGNIVDPTDPLTIRGTINYITGAYDVTFVNPPASGQDVNVQQIQYSAGKPSMILFFNSEFTVWPVPDMPYRIDVTVSTRPSELLDNSDCPELAEWWQYIALGASLKIFEDRVDPDSIEKLMPIFKNQEQLIQNRTTSQMSQTRSATIFNGGTLSSATYPGYWDNFVNGNLNI